MIANIEADIERGVQELAATDIRTAASYRTAWGLYSDHCNKMTKKAGAVVAVFPISIFIVADLLQASYRRVDVSFTYSIIVDVQQHLSGLMSFTNGMLAPEFRRDPQSLHQSELIASTLDFVASREIALAGLTLAHAPPTAPASLLPAQPTAGASAILAPLAPLQPIAGPSDIVARSSPVEPTAGP